MSCSLLGLVQVAAPALVAAVAVLWVFVLIAVYAWVIKPIMEWTSRVDGGFIKRIALWPLRKASEAADRFAREQIAALSRWAAASGAPLAVVFFQLADVVVRVAGTFGDMSEQIYEALWTLTNETVPDKIAAALVPVRAQLTRQAERLDDIEFLNRGAAVIYGDVLRALPWGVPGSYLGNLATFGDRFVQLWNHYYNVTRVQLQDIVQEQIPDLVRGLAALEQRVAVGIDARLDALRADISGLQRTLLDEVFPRLAAVEDGLDALADAIFGPIEGGLTDILRRLGALELEVFTRIPERFAGIEAALQQLRDELEQGVETGLAAFRARIEAIEQTLAENVLPRLDAMQAALDALAEEVFGDVGQGLVAILQQLDALRQYVFGQLTTQIELAIGRIEGIETLLRENVLPRLAGLEALLEPVAFGALVLATMRRVAPNLFCRNVTRASEALCAQSDSWLDELLAIGLPVLVLADICDLARAAQGAVGLIVDVLSPIALGAGSALACSGRPAAGLLPLSLTDLPDDSAAVAL